MPSAVAGAAERTRALPHVEVRRLTIPDEWPDGTFDLVVLSEILYYFDDPALDDVLTRTLDSLEPGGTLVAVHGNHPVAEHRRTGGALAPVLAALPGLRLLTDLRDVDFTLQTFWRRHPDGSAPPSPAAQEGLV